MTLHDKLRASFLAVATGTLRLDAESAAAFALQIANACEGLHVFAQLCTAPNALKSETLAAMLERCFRLLPEFEAARLTLERKAGPLQPVPSPDAASALLLHARVLEIGLSQRVLSPEDALQLANLLGEAAGAFFALEQKCRAPDRHTQKLLCATLRSALGQPLTLLRQASDIYLRPSQG